MKRQIAYFVVIFIGFLVLFGHFINIPSLNDFIDNDATQWYDIIAGFAAFLGVVNLLQLHLNKITRKKKNWRYSIFTLFGFLIMMFFAFVYKGVNGEDFVDALNNQYDFGEDFIDVKNGIYDFGEDFKDLNENKIYDFGEPFRDTLNGIYDHGEIFVDVLNGVYDRPEPFTDINGNCMWDSGEPFKDGNSQWDGGEEFVDGNGKWDSAEEFKDTNKNEKWDVGEEFTDTNKNSQWDDAEEFKDGNGEWDKGETFKDSNYGYITRSKCYEISYKTPESSAVFTPDVGYWFFNLIPYNMDIGHCGNGEWDEGEEYEDLKNDKYDLGEQFTDIKNGTYDLGEEFTDKGNGVYDKGEDFVDFKNGKYDKCENFEDTNNNGVYDIGETFIDNGNGGKFDDNVKWGAHIKHKDSLFYWMFNYFYLPLGASMFALLAFFVASASYRAFKIRNFEATLLLVSGVFLMLGRVPIGQQIPWWVSLEIYICLIFAIFANKFTTKTSMLYAFAIAILVLPAIISYLGISTHPVFNIADLQEWIFRVPATAGSRAIMIGIALGTVAQSFRIITGREKSILGD